MKNRDVYQRDPFEIALLNHGVATVTDALTGDERRTLRFELTHFVCEGQYRSGLVRVLESYVRHQGQPEQPAAWISGFFGSGKSHLAKMLRFLWTDYAFPEDGARARGLARLPDDVRELLTEVSTLGRRGHGLHAAAGTLGAGAGDSVRLALLGVVFKSAGLPESFPQARFCLWLRKNGIYEQVRDAVATARRRSRRGAEPAPGAGPERNAVEAAEREFRRELNDLYVSPLIAGALLAADPHFAGSEKDARAALRAQFPRPADITTDECTGALKDALTPGGEMPCTVVILDEVQQYIGEDTGRSYVVQEVVEACSKRFGDRLLFLGTGQTALSGTPALQRLQGRFTVNVELSDHDVETVIRRVVLAKRPDRTGDVQAGAGRLRRGDRPSPERHPDRPPQRRQAGPGGGLPAAARAAALLGAGVARGRSRGHRGQLRTQLRIVYDAIRRTAGDPVGTVVPADFLFEELSSNLLQSGVLLREIPRSHRRAGRRHPRRRAQVPAVCAGVPDPQAPARSRRGQRRARHCGHPGGSAGAGPGRGRRGVARAAAGAPGRAGRRRHADEAGRRVQPANGGEQRVGGRVPQPPEPSRQRPDGHERQACPAPRCRGAGGRWGRYASCTGRARSHGSSRSTSAPSPRRTAAPTWRCGYATAGVPTRRA